MKPLATILAAGVLIIVGTSCETPRDEPRDASAGRDTGSAAVDDTLSGNLDLDAADTTAAVSDTWSVQAREVDRSVSGIATVEDIRIATHENYDRIVIQMRGSDVPAYAVRYLDEPVIECGSGEEIDVGSGEALEIRLAPARGHTEQGQSTISHDRRSPALPAVKTAVITCDFEANFTLAAGVEGKLPFRVQTLTDPPRLVVDVRHDQ